jgi:hypothetical protein
MSQNIQPALEIDGQKLLTYLNVQYPQTKSWQLHHLQLPVHSQLISLLCGTKLQPRVTEK